MKSKEGRESTFNPLVAMPGNSLRRMASSDCLSESIRASEAPAPSLVIGITIDPLRMNGGYPVFESSAHPSQSHIQGVVAEAESSAQGQASNRKIMRHQSNRHTSMINGTFYGPNNSPGPQQEPVAFPGFQRSPSETPTEKYYRHALGIDSNLYTPIPELPDKTVAESRDQGSESPRGQDHQRTLTVDGGIQVRNPDSPANPPGTRPDFPEIPATVLGELGPLAPNVGSPSRQKPFVRHGRRVKQFFTFDPSSKSADSDRLLISWPSDFTHNPGCSDLAFLTDSSSASNSTRNAESSDRSHGDASRKGRRPDRIGAESIPSQSSPVRIVISSEPERRQRYSLPSSSHGPKSRSKALNVGHSFERMYNDEHKLTRNLKYKLGQLQAELEKQRQRADHFEELCKQLQVEVGEAKAYSNHYQRLHESGPAKGESLTEELEQLKSQELDPDQTTGEGERQKNVAEVSASFDKKTRSQERIQASLSERRFVRQNFSNELPGNKSMVLTSTTGTEECSITDIYDLYSSADESSQGSAPSPEMKEETDLGPFELSASRPHEVLREVAEEQHSFKGNTLLERYELSEIASYEQEELREEGESQSPKPEYEEIPYELPELESLQSGLSDQFDRLFEEDERPQQSPEEFDPALSLFKFFNIAEARGDDDGCAEDGDDRILGTAREVVFLPGRAREVVYRFGGRTVDAVPAVRRVWFSSEYETLPRNRSDAEG